ncbi:MAG: hypothetical protein U0670_21960 [Anaerolineae bacterium]
MTRKDWLQLIVLAGIWGGSFLFIRIGAPALARMPLSPRAHSSRRSL